jgi:hypothetical protein
VEGILRYQTIIGFSLAILLSACAPTSTPTVTVIAPTAIAPTPALISSTPTPSPKTERWRAYEEALAAAFLPEPYLPGTGLCEWELLEQTQAEVYVWAMCQTDSVGGAAMSAPAVIYLGADHTITKVEVPKDGAGYGPSIRQMFPSELQEKILAQNANTAEMWDHLQARHQNPEAPMIAGSGVVLP